MLHFKIENLKFEYGDQIVFENQNLTINKGQKLLIHGPSGCGKTTLINLMSGLLQSKFGKILFENENLCKLTENQLDKLRAKNFGLIFQRLHLLNYLNVEQNIQLANLTLNSCDMNSLIEDLGLSDKRKSKIRQLSVGEAQRVAIARAIANKPKVIFADEPTSALDENNSEKVMKLLFAQTEKYNSTLIVSSHDVRIKNKFSIFLKLGL